MATYGRFSGRGGGTSAYDVMAMAKRQGAEVRGLEAFYDFQQAVNVEARKAEMAQAKGKTGGDVGGFLTSLLAPVALGALGLGTGGLSNVALAALLGTGMSWGGRGIGDVLSRQWSMGGGLDFAGKDKLMSGKLKYKDFLPDDIGPYGQKFISGLQRKAMKGGAGVKGYEQEVQDKFDLRNISRSSRVGSSIISGLLAAAQVSAKAGEIAGGGVEVATGTDIAGKPVMEKVALEPSWFGGERIPTSQLWDIPLTSPSLGRAWEQSAPKLDKTLESILEFFSKKKAGNVGSYNSLLGF